MSGPVAMRACVAWASDGAGGAGDLVAALSGSVRTRAERIERPGALVLGAVGRLLGSGTELRRDLGLAVGTTLGCFATNVAYQRRLAAQGPAGASPRLFAATVSNAAAGEAAIAYGLGGPTFTLATGLTSGLAALDVAQGEIAAGTVRGMIAVGLDVVDDAGRRWLREAGWPADTPAEQVVAVVLGDEPAALPEVGRLGAVALGRAVGDGPGAVARTVRAALARAGVTRAAVVASRRADQARIREALGGATLLDVSAGEPSLLGAGGLASLLAAVREAREPVVVVDLCPSGQVAAAVAWSTSR